LQHEFSILAAESKPAMALKRWRQDRNHSLETLAANPIGCFPKGDQGIANGLAVEPSRLPLLRAPGIASARRTDGMLAMPAGHC